MARRIGWMLLPLLGAFIVFSISCGEKKSTEPEVRVLTRISGDQPEGTPGAALSEPIVVVVKDTLGNPVEGGPSRCVAAFFCFDLS